MAALLGEWVAKSLSLSQPITSFERDLSNGFLFGEVLVALGFASSDLTAKLTDAHSVRVARGAAFCFSLILSFLLQSGVKMANFKALQPALSEVGITLTTKDIRDIITEQRGAATKLLYQLRVAYEAPKPKAKATPSAGATLQWTRESDADLVADPEKRSDLEFVKRAIEAGAAAPQPF